MAQICKKLDKDVAANSFFQGAVKLLKAQEGGQSLKVGAALHAASFAQEYTTQRPPTLVRVKRACYTEEARQARVEGVVAVSAEIHPDGLAHSIRVKRSLEPGLDASAIEAVRQWRFKPGENHGEPVISPTILEVNFRLNDPTQRCTPLSQGTGDKNGSQ